MAKKKTEIAKAWAEVPTFIKIAGALGAAYFIYRGIKKEIERARIARTIKDQQNPEFNTPAVTWGPEGQTLEVPASNIASLANQFYTAYNPDGWDTNEAGLVNALAKTAPQYFRLVENYYLSAYNRNLSADLEEQLGGDSLFSEIWTKYKTQI